nr:hypothetical protein [Ponticaulis sp.]
MDQTFWSIIEIEVQALARGMPIFHFAAQPEVKLDIARIASEIVEYDHEPLSRVCIEILQQGDHPGPLHEITATAGIIGENSFDGIILRLAILAASMFLAGETCTLELLFCGDPAIDESFSWLGYFIHAQHSAPSVTAY